MEIKCIAIDDEPLALQQLESYINKTTDLKLTASFDNAIDARETLQTQKIDLLFVDINMPDMNGVELVQSLTNPPKVIFTTAHREFALDAFALDAADYLLKPLSYGSFIKCVDKIKQRYFQPTRVDTLSVRKMEIGEGEDEEEVEEELTASSNCLYIKSEYRIIRINYDQIKYIESQREYVRIYQVNEKPIMTLMTIKKMEEHLPPTLFMRVHRSFIVNLNQVQIIERNRIVFDKNTYIPISTQYKDAFNEFLDKRFLE
ncbi:MAG: LytTR family DNA-binding domain-containing protein [Bacteroidaceae bacterium]